MAATDVSPPETPLPALLSFVGLRKRRSRHGSATQLLWDKLQNDASLYELCRARQGLTSEDLATLEQCRQKLEVARRCIDKRFWRWSFSFWEVIHELDGLLLLVMPPAMLLPQALDIQHQFERRVTDSVSRELWLGADGTAGPLPESTRLLSRWGRPPTEAPFYPPPEPEHLMRCRHVLRGALGVVNGKVDKTFWQLSINVAIQLLSTVLLLALFVVAFQKFSTSLVESWPQQVIPMGMLLLGLAGSAGAVLSNMLSRERFVVATGATSRYFAYHLLVKPVIGGFAGLMLLFLEQSNLLLAVIPRDASMPASAAESASAAAPAGGSGSSEAAKTAPAGAGIPAGEGRSAEAAKTAPAGAGIPAAESGSTEAAKTAPTGSDLPTKDTGEGPADVSNPAILHLVVSNRKAAFFTMVALAIAAGFSADRLLSSVMDNVLGRLLRQSEKVLPPSAPPVAGTPPEPAEQR